MPSDLRQVAREMFLTAAGPALVKQVADLLGPHGIPVMPLKGVLLQKLVYGEQTFRSISDVDVLVPEARFLDAYSTLNAAGFSRVRWEIGRWEVTLTNPSGPPLGVDLHRALSRTFRSNLTAAGMFERGVPDTRLFGAPVVLPCAEDLFAHLLQHMTLDWINLARVHRPEDLQAVADSLRLDVGRCAAHLRKQGLTAHALVMLPLLREEAGGTFLQELTERLNPTLRARAAARLIHDVCARFEAGHPTRRLAGLALAPSLARALASAVRDRISSSAGAEG